jgi:hypothetical protein
MKRRKFITLLGGGLFVFLWVSAAAQEGYYGEATTKGMRASTPSSKEMTVKVHVAT